MKNFKKTAAIILMVLVTSVVQAQSDKYKAAMKQALTLFDSANVTPDFIASANQFDRIAGVETREWAPAYYAAYSNLLAGIMSQDVKQKDELFDKALQEAEHANLVSPDNSEIYTVKGYIQFMKMSVNPMTRMNLMGAATASLEKAKKLDPANPRPWFVQGQNTFYTPEAFGGGKKTAKPILENAVRLFEAAKSDAGGPDWGKNRALALLEQCK